MVKCRLLLFLLFLGFAALGQSGQVNRYAVFFKDKQGTTFSVDRPAEFLSERSIARRSKQSIAITPEDLPVSSRYLDSLRAAGFHVFYTSKWMNVAIVQDTHDKATALISKSFVDTVVLIARNPKLTAAKSSFTPPTNFSTPSTTSLSSANQNAMLGVDKMHENGFKGEGILIAVLDGGYLGVNKSGVFRHLFEAGLIIDQFDYVTFGNDVFLYSDHGTCVLSSISAINQPNYIGTAPASKIALYVTEESGSEFVIEEYNMLMALERADSIGADVVTTSVGYSDFDDPAMNYTYKDLNGSTAIGTIGVSKAFRKGMVVVTSAGNEGNKAWRYVTVPADAPEVIAVGAVNTNRSLANFSSLGPTSDGRIKPDLLAQGSPTIVLGNTGQFFSGFGTSYAAPQVAGLAAGVWQAKPEWTAQQVVQALRQSGDISTQPNNTRGFGIPHFQRAISGTVLSVRDIFDEKITIYPNPFEGNVLNIMVDKSIKEPTMKLSLYDYSGREIKKWDVATTMDELVQIDTGPLTAGHYILYLEFKKFRRSVKLIKS